MHRVTDLNSNLTLYYEQLRQETLSSSLDRVRAKFRGAGILVSRGTAGWIEVLNDIYLPVADSAANTRSAETKIPTKPDPNITELTSLLVEITLKNLCQEASA